MDNAPKIAILVVLTLVVGAIFLVGAKQYANSSNQQMTQQTDALFDQIGN